jgi:hypothetical protein
MRFNKKQKRSPLHGFLASVLLFVVIVAFFVIGISVVGKGTTKRQQEALENAVTRCITECYAEEGRYPESVIYLIENYGLRFNEDRFYVDYRVSGSNVRPEFTVVCQEDE